MEVVWRSAGDFLKNHLTGPAGSVAWFPFTIRTGRFVGLSFDGTTAAPVSVSMVCGDGADDGSHTPHRDRRVCQRRRQVTYRRAERGVDECAWQRSDEGTDGHLPQRNSERTERIRGERIGDAGDEALAMPCYCTAQAAPVSFNPIPL